MNLHLAEIATQIAPGAHAALLLDQAGWNLSGRLAVPANITVVPLPPKYPELNPVENIGQFLRDNWISNRIFRPYEEMLDHCMPGTSSSISHGSRVHRHKRMGLRFLSVRIGGKIGRRGSPEGRFDP
jgi:hypothetical protein